MKKIIILAVAAIAMAACTKNMVDMTETSQISFTPNALSTKALIFPDANGENAFPTTQAFNVFAFADLGNGAGTNYAQPVMNDVEISYHAATNGGDWKATEGTYLWPATGTVDFYAYYPGNLDATFVSTGNPHIELTGISLGTTIGSQIDPLIANTLAQSKQKVALVFKHITSQIAVTAFEATQTAALQGMLRIKKVEFMNLSTSGDYIEGTTAGKGEWKNVNTRTSFVSFQGNELLELTENYLSAGAFSNAFDGSAAFVVVPDAVNATNGQAIKVTYSYLAFEWNGFNYPAAEETVTVPLTKYMNEFKNGKRYVFHLGISLDGVNNEIMFSPSVSGWETVDIEGITIDAVNAALL